MRITRIDNAGNHNYSLPAKNRYVKQCANFKSDVQGTATPLSYYEEEKLNVLKTGLASIAVVLATGVLVSIFKKGGASSSNPKHKSGLREDLIKPFESLKDDKSIPVLDECKSIDDKLKKFLQKQVKLEELKNNGGEDVQVANRLLMVGPPGVGKTYFAQVYAKTINADFMEIRFADYNSRWVGEGIENMRAIFETIESTVAPNPNKKYVALFNEVESIVTSIDKLNNSSGLSAHMLDKIEERDTFITYMDELAKKCPNLIIIGTTNLTPEKGLDSAVFSRFKKNFIDVNLPNENCLFEAVKKRLSDFKIYKNEDEAIIKDISRKMADRSCSYRDLNAIVDNSYEQYLLEKDALKNPAFNPKMLENELKAIKITDGELYKKNNGL